MLKMSKRSINAAVSVLVMAFLAGCGGQEDGSGKIPWGTDIDAALAEARKSGKIVMVDFMAEWCPPCRAMEDSTFCVPSVVEKAGRFIPVRIDVDEQKEVAVKYGGNARKYGGIGIPNILFIDGDEKKIRHIVGYHGPDALIAAMDTVLTARSRESTDLH
jgi:thiol:disulfide interchange protein